MTPAHEPQSSGAAIVAFPPRRDENGEAWEPWVDEGVVARHYSVSTRTVRRWRDAGMPSRLFGGLRRYRLSHCETWHLEQEGAA